MPTWAKIAVGVTSVVLGLALIGAVASASDEDGDQTEVASGRSTTTEPSTTAPSSTTTRPPATTLPPPTTIPPPPPPTTAPPAPPPEPEPAPVPQPEPEPDAGGGCHPSYIPCVPIDSDVDCASGSGNGPAYVPGPVSVVGPDEYGLDDDGDAIGCE